MVALGRVDPVLSILELDDAALGVPDGAIVLYPEMLQGVDEAALHVAALLGTDGGVDEPLPATH
ncbi:hypothetical protein ES707_15699 [subsurface metagenome]